MKQDNIEERIRDAMTGEQTAPRNDVWDSIAARRGGGERVPLPTTVGRQWRVVVAVAIAASILFLLAPFLGKEEAGPRSQATRLLVSGPNDEGGFLSPGSLMAQSSGSPAFMPVEPVGTTLRPGTWSYASARPGHAPQESFRFSLSRSTYEGTASWLMISGNPEPFAAGRATDSLWLSADSLRPLYRVGRSGSGEGRIEHTYREDEVLIGTTMNGYTSWKVKPLRDSTDDARYGGIMRLPDLGLQFRGMVLSSGWQGSLPLPTENPTMIASIWLNLAVDGEEELTVPAGRFTTWRLRTAHPDRTMPKYDPVNPDPGLYFWVSKDRQWLIQMSMVNPGKGRYDQVLFSAKEE